MWVEEWSVRWGGRKGVPRLGSKRIWTQLTCHGFLDCVKNQITKDTEMGPIRYHTESTHGTIEDDFSEIKFFFPPQTLLAKATQYVI